MRNLPHTHSCFVCGEFNPLGLKIRFQTDGNTVQTRFLPRSEHIGFKQTVHGGITATILDEIMVWAIAVKTNRFAYCAELNVRYQQPARPDEELLAVAELVTNRRGKIYEAKAELKALSGQVIATATGKYLPVPEQDAQGMLEDFIGDPSTIFTPKAD